MTGIPETNARPVFSVILKNINQRVRQQIPFLVICLALLVVQARVGATDDGGIEKIYFSKLSGTTLLVNRTAVLTYAPEYATSRKIQNIISLSLFEETADYIPGSFTATVTVRIDYGESVTSFNTLNQVLQVNYDTAAGAKYNAKKYFSFEGAQYVKITVVAVNAPAVGGYDTKKALVLQNEMRVTRYYTLKAGVAPTTFTAATPANTDDELNVSWVWPDSAGHTHTQLEWTWLANELADDYLVNGILDTNLLFTNNCTRVELPAGIGTYKVHLLYGDTGKLYCRIRAVNSKGTGMRADGPWTIRIAPFNGHSALLNWQATTIFSEEGKRKVVIQYFDGSLRSRQTVTKDNVTGTTVTVETMYDAQGRPAIQVLPTPGIRTRIAYTTNLNLFKRDSALGLSADQALNTDPLKYFDLQPVQFGGNITPALNTTSGSGQYYSASNVEINTGTHANIPDAEGYPYTVTRYTPDGTSRIMAQSAPGYAMRMGSGHETKYYYGTAAQEELDGLFGTEVGNYTHYFKNMVKDANGQMSVNYVDLGGRTIATALAGDAPENIAPLNLLDTANYRNQKGSPITRNLLNRNSNVVKNNSIEAINSLLVPATTNFAFTYELNPDVLQLTSCSNTPICYDCLYDLEFSIVDESGEAKPIVRKFSNIGVRPDDTCSTAVNSFKDLQTGSESNIIQFNQLLLPGSYTIRKTLTLSTASLQTYKEMFLTRGLCKVEQQIIDSVYSALLKISPCDEPLPANTCTACLNSLGDYPTYRTAYLKNLTATQVSAALEAEIQAAYYNAQSNCNKLCNTASQVLATKRTLMLADMVPYSGQYAKSGGSGSMYNKYNIFSTANGAAYPFYRDPRNSSKATDYYRNEAGIPDLSIQPDSTLNKLKATDTATFTRMFTSSWARALLPHHPEYDQLVFAETQLADAYNWINAFSNTATFAEASTKGYVFTSAANLNDPFYTTAPSYKGAMAAKISSDYRNGLNLWQIAYGDAACKTIVLPDQKDNCYKNAPKTPPYNNLSTPQKEQVWLLFRNLYAAERDLQVNNYIVANKPVADAQTLVNQGYLLQFPTNNDQLAQQYSIYQQNNTGQNDWAWYPTTPGGAPNINSLDASTPVQVYEGRCNSQVPQWKQVLSQCAALKGRTDSAQIVEQIVAGFLTVCRKGSDDANPFGASNVAPSAPIDGTPRSFEEVITSVYTQYGIAKTNLCNAFVIEYPKPYGKNPVFTKEMIGAIDTCHCKQFTKLKNEATADGKNPAVLSSFNQYLRSAYGDTLTVALFNGLNQGCPVINVTACYDTTYNTAIPGGTIPCNCTLVAAGVMRCTRRICNQVSPHPLTTPQPLPEFLKCGFIANDKCITCTQISKLVDSFKKVIPAPYNAGPITTGTDLTPTNIRDNILFAQFVNYRLGYQYTWMDYVKAAAAASPACNLALYKTNTSAAQSVICRNTVPLNDTTGYFVTEPRCAPVYDQAVTIARQLMVQRREYLLADFEERYRAKCLAAVNTEKFIVNYTVKEYHYTLYYYDMAGNLVKTVPPKGVTPDFSPTFTDSVKTARANNARVVPPHVLTTNYRYNSLDKIIAQNTPDGGTTKFWYDKLFRLAVSQNAQQLIDKKYSYLIYDSLGRVTEVGQKPQTTAMTQTISQDITALKNWIITNGGVREQLTFTVYDRAYTPVDTLVKQKNLRNRVSYTATKDLATDDFQAAATFYTYDVHGNVDTLLQDYRGISGSSNRFKLIAYNYDLVSGKVNEVNYQPGKADAFYHRYKYDADKRLTLVETSRDKIIWERDAAYTYNKYGPLARCELGQLRVQGLDYAYTLQGWLKGVNSTVVNDGQFDIGKDGLPGGPNSVVARDVMGFALHYYDSANANWLDYSAIGGHTAFARTDAGLSLRSLYNGNIAAISMNNAGLLKNTTATNGLPLLYKYRYDQLNRLVNMEAYKGLNAATNQWMAIAINDYKEAVSYDANGNIITYNRNGAPAIGKPVQMDALNYNYAARTNQLTSISDNITTADYIEDLETQGGNNYAYDAIGNLKKDSVQCITNITWTVYGKIATIVKNGSTIAYTYDAAGNRISKTVNGKTTIYVRDANGSVMSVYEKSTVGIKQAEVHIYGSSRLGIVYEHIDTVLTVNLAPGSGVAMVQTFKRGEKSFELGNHLGNVLATISDKKIQHSSNNTSVDYYLADVSTANDYYPFGMPMPGRSYARDTVYRYGFNGKENDNEVNQQDYGMRMYDPRIGRFLSVDPMTQAYPWYTPYQFAGNKPILAVDLDGLEEKPVHDLTEFQKQFPGLIKVDASSTAADIKKQVRMALMKVYYIKEVNGEFKFDMGRAMKQVLSENVKTGSEASDRLGLYRFSANRTLENFDHFFGGQFARKHEQQLAERKKQMEWEEAHQLRMKQLYDEMITVEDVIQGMDWAGKGMQAVGYLVVLLPGGQVVGGALVATGKTLEWVSFGLDVTYKISNGEFEKAGVKVLFKIASKGTDKLIKESLPYAEMSPTMEKALKYGTKAFFKAAEKIVENDLDKKDAKKN